MHALTIGGATIDTIAIIESSRIERMTMLNADTSYLLLAEGQKTEALEISTHCGGGAVNAAVALARLGHDVSSIAKLGSDKRAETVLARLMQEGISDRWIGRAAGAATGASVFVSSHERNAAIFTYRGANALLESRDLDPAAFHVGLVHVSSLSNQSADCFPKIARLAKDGGAFLSANPGIRQLSSRGDALRRCLGRIDLLTMNSAEAAVLVPGLAAGVGEGGPGLECTDGSLTPRLARVGLAYGGYELGLRSFFVGLIAEGVRRVLVTDGASGAYLADVDRVLFCPAMTVNVAGTAGAGDAYAATLACFLAEGCHPEIALRAGALNAASVVAHVDTQTGLMHRAALDASLAAPSAKLELRAWPLNSD